MIHAALVTSACKAAYDAAFPSVTTGGILLVRRLCPLIPYASPDSDGGVRDSYLGFLSRHAADMRELLSMAAAGKVRWRGCNASTDASNEFLSQLRHGQVPWQDGV